MIDIERFLHGHALNPEDQPALVDLFDAVRLTETVTFVIGAGVSANAGLPVWSVLLNRLLDSPMLSEEFSTMARQDHSDPLRRAEFVLGAARRNHGKPNELVAEALYRDTPVPQPGPIAEALAKLGTELNSRARYLTTNYDEIVETALAAESGKEIASFGLLQHADWVKHPHAESPSVMHLHGMLGPQARGGRVIEPVILTESFFLLHGPTVREALTRQLQAGVVIFIGVGMTDPNLVGPLWATKVGSTYSPDHRAHRVFVLNVPRPIPGGLERSRRFEVEKAQYLEDTLDTTPLFLKSYSQLAQLLNELRLSLIRPEYDIRSTAPGNPGYSSRYRSILDHCYHAIGCSPGAEMPTGKKAEKLSSRLHELIQPASAVRVALEKARDRFEQKALVRMPDDDEEEEEFGLFLWLRHRNHVGDRTPYMLNLVGTSTYVHREEWSFRRRIDIDQNSNYPVSQTMFRGSSTLVNLPDNRVQPLWKSQYTIPISIVQDHGRETTIVGALALASTRLIVVPSDQPSDRPPARVSVFRLMRDQAPDGLESIGADLQASVRTLLGY